jgi:hypothetical protein
MKGCQKLSIRPITMDLQVFYYRANSEVAGVAPFLFFMILVPLL